MPRSLAHDRPEGRLESRHVNQRKTYRRIICDSCGFGQQMRHLDLYHRHLLKPPFGRSGTRNSRSGRLVVDQLVDQLKAGFWGDGPRKCDTYKALDFLTLQFGTRGSEVQILSPRPIYPPQIHQLHAAFLEMTGAHFVCESCETLAGRTKPRPIFAFLKRRIHNALVF